jgi:phage terminase small subunit
MNIGPQKRKRVLTAKQFRFIEEYQVDLNANQAATRSGYSRRRAGEIGYQLLQKTTIQQAIAVKRKELSQQLGLTSEQIIREAARIAFSDVRKLFDESGALKHTEEVDEGTAAAIASIEVVEACGMLADGTHVPRYTKRVRFWDKNAALEKLMKHLGLFKDDNKQKTDAIGGLLAAIDGKSARLTIKS